MVENVTSDTVSELSGVLILLCWVKGDTLWQVFNTGELNLHEICSLV